jgi:hypothetical protein
MNRWAVAPGGCTPGVKELALVIVAVEWVWLNGQMIFPRSMLALPHAWRDWLLAHGVACASAALWAQSIGPRGRNLRISASQEHTPPQLPSVKELTDSLE